MLDRIEEQNKNITKNLRRAMAMVAGPVQLWKMADVGLAKKGNALRAFNGTQPYMAREMLTDRLYTAAVDIWAHGMVVARYLSRGRPGGYSSEEGPRWCAAVGFRADLIPAQAMDDRPS